MICEDRETSGCVFISVFSEGFNVVSINKSGTYGIEGGLKVDWLPYRKQTNNEWGFVRFAGSDQWSHRNGCLGLNYSQFIAKLISGQNVIFQDF